MCFLNIDSPLTKLTLSISSIICLFTYPDKEDRWDLWELRTWLFIDSLFTLTTTLTCGALRSLRPRGSDKEMMLAGCMRPCDLPLNHHVSTVIKYNNLLFVTTKTSVHFNMPSFKFHVHSNLQFLCNRTTNWTQSREVCSYIFLNGLDPISWMLPSGFKK